MKTILGYSSKTVISVLNNIMQSWSRVFRLSKKIYNPWWLLLTIHYFYMHIFLVCLWHILTSWLKKWFMVTFLKKKTLVKSWTEKCWAGRKPSLKNNWEVYLEPSLTFTIGLFCKKTKISIVDVQLGSCRNIFLLATGR